MKINLSKEEAAKLIQAGLNSDETPIVLKGDVQSIAIKVTQNGVTLDVALEDHDEEYEE
jgi:hypothetical protein